MAGGHTGDQGQHHVQHGGQHQRFPGHGYVGDSQQEGGNGGKGHYHDQVVDRHLHQRVVGIAFDQLAPNEHHGGTGCHAQQDHAGDVLAGRLRIDPGRKDVLEEKHAQCGHRKGFD